MIYIITGQPRNGKSQRIVKMIYDFIDDNLKREEQGKEPRLIWCDIAGINDEDTPIKMPEVQTPKEFNFYDKLWLGEQDDPRKPEDFICPPKGSVLIYDECHRVEWLKADGKALSTHPTTVSINEHGHEDYILIFMTQFPAFVHKHIHGLTEYHWHVKRPHGMKFANVYKWNDYQFNPRSEKAIRDAFEVEKFFFKDKYQDSYKSASAHDSMKVRFPKKLIYAVIAFLLLLCLIIWRFMTSPLYDMFSGKDGSTISGTETETVATQQPQTEQTTSFNQLEKYSRNEMQIYAEVEYLKETYLGKTTYTLLKDEAIRPAMVIATSTTCKVYNSYGEMLLINQDICNEMDNNPALIPRSRIQQDMQEKTANDDGFSVQEKVI